MKCLPLIILMFLLVHVVSAQEKTEEENEETILVDENSIVVDEDGVVEIITETPRNRPNKIALYSALFPGLGQIHNRRSWKLPIIYGGAAVLLYGVSNFNTQYLFFRDALFAEVDLDPDTLNETGFNESQLRRRTDAFRRNRDYFLILTGLLYVLNIVDAHVDAHLREFDINEDLSFTLKPSMIQNSWNIPNVGLSLQLNVTP